ncbi:MAG: hypothetical protein HON04_13620 [Planctomicrobium sp.]|jgi:flagellar basal body P-ring formation protein FlgA|nr:hypothetical protein [Planctomicrobium sp.]
MRFHDILFLNAVYLRQQLLLLTVVFNILTMNGIVSAAEPVISVKLLTRIQVDPGLVRLSDVAVIAGRDEPAVRSISDLDLCHLQTGDEKRLTRAFLELRLSLAVVHARNVRWSGSQSVIVTTDQSPEKLLLQVEQEIENKISHHLDRPLEDIRIRFLRPLEDVFVDEVNHDAELMPEVVISDEQPIGRKTIEVRLLNDRNVISSRSVSLEISVKQSELRVKELINRNELIGSENVYVFDSFVTSLQDQVLPADVYGRLARRNLRVGERLDLSDLQPELKTVPQEIVVRPRDAIRLIARHKNLEYVVPQAEAMQSGEIGQIIKVKNLQSNRVVHARLVSHDEAVVDLQ